MATRVKLNAKDRKRAIDLATKPRKGDVVGLGPPHEIRETPAKRPAKPRVKREPIVTYELCMPVVKAGDDLENAIGASDDPEFAHLRSTRAVLDGLSLSAQDWALGAAMLGELRWHLRRRELDLLAKREALDIVVGTCGHSITVTGTMSALGPMLTGNVLKPWWVKLG